MKAGFSSESPAQAVPPPTTDSALPGRWWRGVLTWWPVKMAGTAIGMMVFFFAYFQVLHHPFRPVTIMPLTAIDRWIGFQPEALPLYLSLWCYILLAPALVVDRRELVSFGAAWVALAASGLGVFLFWPTAVPAATIDWSRHPAVAFLKAADATGNACPSLHVAFAVFSAIWLGRHLGRLGASRVVRGANWLWCAGILYATIAIRQHVFLDVLAGAGLGLAVALAHLRWLGAGRSSPVRPPW
ncbi:MAG TPA: phosphatase PAP2 family protein [Lacunisphaera sp.]|jgi:hypothetical protein|nr:phosphatase PAP2 family protein [Lacunisphaera sp.]